jgi:hypothetical protein
MPGLRMAVLETPHAFALEEQGGEGLVRCNIILRPPVLSRLDMISIECFQ